MALVALAQESPAAVANVVLYVDQHALGPVHDGSSWCRAFLHLQDALAQAVDSGGIVTEIRVADGVYTPDRGADQTRGDRFATFQLLNGVTIKGGYAGCARITYAHKPDRTAYETILSGDLSADDTPGPCSEYSDCCVEHDTIGCDNPACEAIVCELVPKCCGVAYDPTVHWGEMCVVKARHYCCDPFYNSCENSLHVVTATGTDGTAILEGFTISGGYSAGETGGDLCDYTCGGGLFSEGGSATIRNCTFRDNSAGAGGAIYAMDAANLALQGCTFTGNAGASTSGGSAVFSMYSDPIFEDCTFVDNLGVAMVSIGDPTLVRCAFISNEGGGLDSPEGDPILTDCTFMDNSGSTWAGMTNDWGHPILTNCAFIGNYGTAMHKSGRGSLTLINSTFLGNHGTALYCGGALVVNCVFSGNYGAFTPAIRTGGARMVNCTVVSNSSDNSPAIRGSGARTIITNSIIWGNTAGGVGGESAQIGGRETEFIISDSIIEGWTGAYGGTGNSGQDPLLVDPLGPDGIAGTEDDNLRLTIGSPAIDAGDTDAVGADQPTDLDGEPRVIGAAIDMGAYEGPKPTFILRPYVLSIDEGHSTSFTVALTMEPAVPVSASVAVYAGDPDITVVSGETIEFTPDDYFIAQTVTLAAAQDVDFTNGTAVVRITAPDIAVGHLLAVEVDDEAAPPVLYVDLNAPGENPGTGWADAFRELEDALAAARDRAGVSEIWGSAGTHRPSIRTNPLDARTATFRLVDGVGVYGGFAGWETTVDQRDPRRNVTVLSGDLEGDDGPGLLRHDDNSCHVVTVQDTRSGTHLDGFTISAGTTCDFPDDKGAGIAALDADLTVSNCVITRNRAGHGAGMYNSFSDVVLDNCVFRDNYALWQGAGMDHGGGTLTLSNSIFTGNRSTLTSGAGAYVSSDVTVTGCTFSHNYSAMGGVGGLQISYGTALITNSIFWGNEGGDGFGVEMAQFLSLDELIMQYNSVEGWTGTYGGMGNNGHDPLFVDALGPDGIPGTEDDDLRLSPDSPAISAGDPAYVPDSEETDLDGNPRLAGCRVDMGAYEAAMEQLPGDFDGNGHIDLADVAGFQLCMGPWTSNPDWLGTCLCIFDADENEDIDLTDFAAFHEAFRSSE